MNPQTPIFYVTGGTLRHDAPSYVERGADRGLFDGLLRGEFCYVLTSRQMGKSSLMVRTASKLRDQGIVVVVLDLTAVGQNVTPEQWYHGLLMRVGRQLWAEDELERFWDAHPKLSPVQRFFSALRDGILGRKHGASRILKPDGRVVVFVDEIDVVRSLPFRTDEFFAAIRECYNRRTEDREFERVTFCLLGVATPSDLITDTRITPFNIGRRIELHDFTPAEAAALAAWLDPRLALPQSRVLLERVLHWTNGHPYLTQRLCQAVAENSTTANEATRGSTSRVDTICAQLFFTADARENDDNLIFVRERLLRSDEVDRVSLLALYGQMVARKTVQADRTNPLISILYLSGVARPDAGRLVPRNRIYERVFDRHWIDANLPEADVRRQREAFRRGVIRTTAIAALIVAAMTVMVFIAANQARKARAALAAAYFSQARATRVSGVSGRRSESLAALRAARRDHPDPTALRDEVIACLGLVDLKERTNDTFSAADISALNIDLGISATAEPGGAIAIRAIKDGSLLKRHSGFGVPVEQLWLARTRPYLIAELKKPPRNRLVVWNWQDDRQLFAADHGVNGRALDISSEENALAVADRDASILIYSLPGGEKLGHLQPLLSSRSPKKAGALRFSPGADLLAVSSPEDHFVDLWEIRPRKLLRQFYHRHIVNDLAWHPQGQLLASACADGAVYLWAVESASKEPLQKLLAHENQVTSIAFNDRGNLLASLGKDETLRLWNPASDSHIMHRLLDATLGELRFRSNDRLLVANGKGKARIWEVLGSEYTALQRRGILLQDFAGMDFSPDGRLFAAWTSDSATIWDLESGSELTNLLSINIAAACFGADGNRIYVSTDSGLLEYPIQRHAIGTGFRITAGQGSQVAHVPKELGYLALTPDRTRAALVHQTDILRLALGAQAPPSRIKAGERFAKLALHPAGSCVAAANNRESVVRIFGGAAPEAGPAGTSIRGEYFAFSPDGHWLGVCAHGHFDFYRFGSWDKPAFTIPRSRGSEQHGPVAFSPDGKIVAIADSRYYVRLYLLGSGEPKPLGLLEGPDRKLLLALAFSPDGRRLAALAKDQGIQLWDLALVRQGLMELNLHEGWPEYSIAR